jgi:hypothetical protein
MTRQEIDKQLHDIGFTGFIHLKKEMRDGKKRWIWNYPIKNDLFVVLIVEKAEHLVIEKLTNPLGVTFEDEDIAGLIQYIRSNIWKY